MPFAVVSDSIGCSAAAIAVAVEGRTPLSATDATDEGNHEEVAYRRPDPPEAFGIAPRKENEFMCLPVMGTPSAINAHGSPLIRLQFGGGTPLLFGVTGGARLNLQHDVRGFGAGLPQPLTQERADAVAARLHELYDALPDDQKPVLQAIMEQAASYTWNADAE